MKSKFSVFVLVFCGFGLIGQNVPKYVLIEHFTNTWCSVCASKNPALKDLIQKYPKNVHHVSIHPPYPYSSCPLYQYNKSENLERATYYKVLGSPTVVMNGTLLSNATPLISEATLKQEITKTSVVSLLVSETKNGGGRSATVSLKSITAISGDLRLIVLLAEKNLRFTASNGELDHFNVFRKFLTPVTGQKITIGASGEQKFVFNYNDDSNLNSNEIYALAYVQNASTNEVLNSGTKFDEVSTALELKQSINALKIYPTITSSHLWVELPNEKAMSYSIFNSHGSTVRTQKIAFNNNSLNISTSSLASGVYWVKLVDNNQGIHIAKFVKQ